MKIHCKKSLLASISVLALYLAFGLACPVAAAPDWDVGVAWLERDPKHPVPIEDVGKSDWPKPGETVEWTAHLYSNSPAGSLPEGLKVKVDWIFNTVKAGSSEAAIGPDGFGASSFKWTLPENYAYDFTHALTNYVTACISFEGFSGDRIEENNSLSVCMDALVFSTKICWKTFRQYTDPAGLSFFDRMNANLAWMNSRFAVAKYPMAPDGIIDRYRIDHIEMTDLEYEPNLEPGDPNATTRLFFCEAGKMGAFYNAPYYWIGQTYFYVDRNANTNGIFSTMGLGAVTHEAGHSLQLPDTYIFDLSEEANHVTHERIGCDWMDAHGLVDMMRYPYLEDSNFTELSAVAANFQAGVFRRQVPEIMYVKGERKVGWMYACLPKTIGVRYFAKNGQELSEGTPITFYRGTRDSYYISMPDNDIVLKTGYKKGGVYFTPKFDVRDHADPGKNTFLVKADFPDGRSYAKVLDQLHFNYRYIKGEKETQTFSFTNDFATVSIGGAWLEVLPGAKNMLLSLHTDSKDGVMVRCSGTREGLAASGWAPLTDAMIVRNWLQEGRNVIFTEARSKDGFTTGPKAFSFIYDAEKQSIRKIEK